MRNRIFGDNLSDFVNNLITGGTEQKHFDDIDLGVPFLCKFKRHQTDRNRTSPFAFTGNKFEVRCVGGAQNPGVSNTILNTIVSDSFDYISEAITKLTSEGLPLDAAIDTVIKETLEKHIRIVFDGNGYSQEWVVEAEKRGLLNLRNTPQTIKHCLNEKNFQLFESQKVYSRAEFESYIRVESDNYKNTIETEAKALLTLANRYIIPAALNYLRRFDFSSKSKETTGTNIEKRFHDIEHLVNDAMKVTNHLNEKLEEFEAQSSDDFISGIQFLGEQICPAMLELRSELDKLETLLPANEWPIPSYLDLLSKLDTN